MPQHFPTNHRLCSYGICTNYTTFLKEKKFVTFNLLCTRFIYLYHFLLLLSRELYQLAKMAAADHTEKRNEN
jgi:hypothetical protein